MIGLLNHACKVVCPGRTFFHNMIDLLSATGRTGLHHSHHHIHLNREFRADLAWWRCFVEHLNGVELIQGCITCYCNNQRVVAVMNSRSSCDRHLMHLLRCLFFYEARGQFKLLSSHIPGIHNGRADHLSGIICLLLLKVPTADKLAAAIPATLPNLLLSMEVDWISPAWIWLFNSTLNRAWPSPPNAHTEQQ